MNLDQLRNFKPQILSYAEQYGVEDIRVFGSVARGDAGEDSDIDFLVTLDPDTRYRGYLKFVQSLTDMIGRRVQVVDEAAIVHPLVRQSIYEDLRVL